jgi:uncharacterized protein YunC (DUF1805 family)
MKILILFAHLNGLLVNSHQHLLKFGMLEVKQITPNTFTLFRLKQIDTFEQIFEFELIENLTDYSKKFDINRGLRI